MSDRQDGDVPFRRTSREVVTDNPWHRYVLDGYTQRDGSPGRYYFIDIAGSAATIPLFDDGTTVLVHAFRYLFDAWMWEFPIGGMQPGEPALDVAKKELKEEAGLTASRWTSLGHFAPYKGVSNERCHYFLAEDLTLTDQDLEPSEMMTVHRMPLEEARHRLLDQRVPDGQSLVGLLLLDRHVARS